MKALQVTLLKFVLFYCIMLTSAHAMAQTPAAAINVPEKETLIDKTVPLIATSVEMPAIQAKDSYCLSGYRIKLRRQKDYYLIPWALRKKHFRTC